MYGLIDRLLRASDPLCRVACLINVHGEAQSSSNADRKQQEGEVTTGPRWGQLGCFSLARFTYDGS